jgi:hypothetical protein
MYGIFVLLGVLSGTGSLLTRRIFFHDFTLRNLLYRPTSLASLNTKMSSNLSVVDLYCAACNLGRTAK